MSMCPDARTRVFRLLAILAPLACATTHGSQVANAKPRPVPRIEQILVDQDITNTIDEDGDFRVVFDVDDGRSQMAFIRSRTSRYDDLEIREILSVAYRPETERFPREVSDALLEDTYAKKLGAWGKQGDVAVFVVRIAADAMERQLSGDTDEF